MNHQVKKKYRHTCAPSEDSDQPVHYRSLIRIFTVRAFDSQKCKVSSREQRRLWSDCAHAQADLSLRWAHMVGVRFQMLRIKCFKKKGVRFHQNKSYTSNIDSYLKTYRNLSRSIDRYKMKAKSLKISGLKITKPSRTENNLSCANSVDSDQPAHPRSLITVYADR